MKKIIFSLLCIMMLCTAVTFAAETETVGGKITLTQFLGVSREDAVSVAITISSETNYVDKNAFYDISDSLMLTSALEPEPMAQDGTYITIEKKDGGLSYAFIGQSGGVDRYGALMSREPYVLYTADDQLKINEITALANPKISVNEKLDITINGQKADFTLKPFIDENGRTLVPAREFCDFIHKYILWFENPARIAIYPHSGMALETDGYKSNPIFFRIGEKNYEINGKFYETDTAAQLVNGNTYVPLRTAAELLGYNVVYLP